MSICNYTKHNIKFLNLFHDYIQNLNKFPKFYIINDDKSLTIVFDTILSKELKLNLDNVVQTYISPQYYIKNLKSIPLNISINKTNSEEYISVATSIHSNIHDIFGSVSIVSNITLLDTLGFYKIRIYDSINNKVIYETSSLNNSIYQLITLDNLQYIPKDNTLIEIQVKVSNKMYIANIKAVNFNFIQILQ